MSAMVVPPLDQALSQGELQGYLVFRAGQLADITQNSCCVTRGCIAQFTTQRRLLTSNSKHTL